ncbi:MAG: LacI family DNA-binding transcriptional regulator [Microbacterium sp.]
MTTEGTGRPATISDVAAAAHVSRTTVSRFLGKQYGSMSPATKARIEAAIAELRYRPSRIARGLRQDRSFTLGFIVPDLTNPFAIRVLRGAEEVAEKHGYMLMVCNSDRDPDKERRYFEMLSSYGTDGLLVFTTGHNDEAVAELSSRGMPIVLIDQDVPSLAVDYFGTDNNTAVADAVTHLLDSGYDDIGFFTDMIASTASRIERAEMFRARLAQSPDVAARVFEADVRDDGQLDEGLDAFLRTPQGTARVIFASNGVMMLKLYGRLKARGIRIPDDVSLIGFDDDEWAQSAEPPLTTIAQSTRELGARALERLLERINGQAAETVRTRMPSRLIVRGSTRAQEGAPSHG